MTKKEVTTIAKFNKGKYYAAIKRDGIFELPYLAFVCTGKNLLLLLPEGKVELDVSKAKEKFQFEEVTEEQAKEISMLYYGLY